MDLAKPSLDAGMYVTDADKSRAFYEGDVGLAYEELLPVGGGVRQHRLALHGSVLKLNESRNDLAAASTGYRALRLAGHDPADLVDPDGTAICIVPKGVDGIEQLGIDVGSADPVEQGRFYVEALGAERLGDGCYRVGTTIVRVIHDPDMPRTGPLQAAGFRYITVQVYDVQKEHARVVELGFQEAMPPRKLGEVAAISFVRDPGGNWVEISQRASLTGELPDQV